MTDFPDLSDFFDPDLYLVYRGKRYRVPCENAHDGLRLRQILASGPMTMAQEHVEALKLLGATWSSHTEKVPVFVDGSDAQKTDDVGELVFKEITVGEWTGGVYQEMADDGASIEVILHAGMTALHKAVNGRDEAMDYWVNSAPGRNAAGGQGKAPAPSKAPAKKSPPKKATKTARSSSRASTGRKSTTAAQARTATTTPAAATTTP